MSETMIPMGSFQVEHVGIHSEKAVPRASFQPRAKVQRDEDDKSLISQIDGWMSDNGYIENITIGEAAQKFGVTVYKIKRVFEEHYGMHFKEYKNHLRNEMAKTLLESTTMSLADISRQVGYNDTSNFRKEFENEVKISPKEYRIKAKTNCL